MVVARYSICWKWNAVVESLEGFFVCHVLNNGSMSFLVIVLFVNACFFSPFAFMVRRDLPFVSLFAWLTNLHRLLCGENKYHRESLSLLLSFLPPSYSTYWMGRKIWCKDFEEGERTVDINREGNILMWKGSSVCGCFVVYLGLYGSVLHWIQFWRCYTTL